MGTHRRNPATGERLNIFNHAHDARERGVLDWISNSDFNKNENHIFFDFETVPTGAKKKTPPYVKGRFIRMKDRREVEDEDGKPIFELSELGVEPFELGLSVRTSTGERIHRSFLFTPPKINFHSGNPYKAGWGITPQEFHDKALNFHLTDDHKFVTVRKKTSEDAPDGRYEHLQRVLLPYTKGEIDEKGVHQYKGKPVAVPWSNIDDFLLTECGVDPKKMTNFIAHHGGFDFPILERMIANIGGKKSDGGRGSVLGKLYRKINDTGSVKWSGRPDSPWWGGYHNDRNRRRGNKSEGGGGYRQDTMIELMRLFGDADEDSKTNNERFVLRKAHHTGKRLDKNGEVKKEYHRSYSPVGYAPGLEYAGGGGFATGTSIDDFRASIEYCAFGKDANNPVKDLFEELKRAVESGEDHRLLKTEGDDKPGLTEAFAKELTEPKYTKKTAKDYYMAFNAVSAHEGAGDTAFTTEVMFPFLETMLKFFDHSQYHPFDEEDNFIKGQGDAFMDAFQQLQDNWGGMLGAYPKLSDRINTFPCPPLNINKVEAGTGHGLLDGIRNRLNNADKPANRDKWFDAAGNQMSGLLGPIVHSPTMKGTETPLKRSSTTDTGDSTVAEMIQEDKMPNVKDFPEDLQHLITGPITIRKWKGSDKRGPRIVVSVPIGNTRVAFSESYWDASNRDTPNVSYKPLLGIAGIGTGKDSEIQLTRAYLQQLLIDFEDEKAPFGKLGRAIQQVLGKKHAIITAEMDEDEAGGELDHRELNDFINTPASAWLSQSLGDNPITAADIRALGMPVQDDDPTEATTYKAYKNQVFRIFNQLLESDDPLGEEKYLMLFGAPHLVDQLEQFNEKFNPEEMFNQFLNKNQLDPALYTLVDGDPEAPVFAPTAEGGQEVNMARLLTTFFSGNEATDKEGNLVEGLHPQQFLHYESLGSGGLLSAFYNYLEFSHKVGQGEEVGQIIFDQTQHPPRDPYETHNQTSQGVLIGIADNDESSEEEQQAAVDEVVRTTHSSDVSQAHEDRASDGVKQTRDNKETFEQVRTNSTSAKDFKANINALLDSLGINAASPFVTDNYIESIRGQNSVDAAYNALFIPREPEKTLDGVQNLINEAVERYGGASDTQNATTLVRELEWIRTNHPSVFTQESMNTALNANDSESVQGQYLDIMNTAYKAMGDLAGEKLSLIQEEQVHMGDRFMSSSHKQYLAHNYNEEHEDNWYDVDDPTTVQEHFAPEPEQESRSFRDIARDMAVATAKAPLEALKYYTNWNALSEQYKDVSSGRTEAGQKLLDAVRRGEKFREVNIGTPEEPQYAGTEREYNYYIANIPVGGEAQPNILRQFLQGKKTYGDLAGEQEESQAGKISRIRNVISEQRKWEQQQIKERSTFATTPITPEQQQQGVEAHDYFTGRRGEYEEDVKGVVQQSREGEGSVPGYKQEEGLFVPKSLDKLRDYLLRV